MEKMEASSVDSGGPGDVAADEAYPSKWLWVDRNKRVHVLAHLRKWAPQTPGKRQPPN